MNSSITVKINPRHLNAGTPLPLMAKVYGWLDSLSQRAFATQDTKSDRSDSVRHLLALADAYAETQPSYAADLRAAALAHERAEDAHGDLGRRVD